MQQDEIEQAQTQAKQMNAIRKAAIQSFQPVITKIQQHIAFLINQTTKLRQKNQILQKTVMDHKAINEAVSQLREDINKVRLKIGENEKRNESQNINFKGQIVTITVELEKINAQIKKKQAKINDLFDKNSEQSNKIDTTADNFKELVEQYSLQVSTLQANNKKLSQNIKSLESEFESQVKILSDSIHEKDQKIQQSAQKLELYMAQRQQLNIIIKDIWGKVDKTVDIQKYEHDWKIIRMENQQMKRENKKMIDEALTPDVRKFLPQMMQRMEEIRKVNRLEEFAYQQKARNDTFQKQQQIQIHNLKKELQKSRQYVDKIHKELQIATTQKFSILGSKLQQGNESTTQTISAVQEQTTKLILEKQSQIRSQISSLLDKNRENIYQMVVNLIPQEEKDFFNKMKQFMPILDSTKKQIMQRCDQITEFGKGLQQRLQSFNNRIVKIKGDLNVEVQTIKKKSKNLQNSIMIIADNFRSLGKVISSYCELFLLQYALSFDPVDKQVYVTGADGIVYENTDSDYQMFYRKTKCNRDQLRRSIMSNLIKLTDSLMSAQQYNFMYIGQYKPSSFFKPIKQSILSGILANPVSKKKQRKYSAKIREGSLENKLPIIDNNQSKTIDFSQQDSSKQIQAQTLTSDFSNARRKQRPYRGRYSQMK